MPLARFLLSALKNGSRGPLHIFRRFGGSESYCTCRTRLGAPKRFYSSSARSTRGNNPLPLLGTSKSPSSPTPWRSFLIPGTIIAGIGGFAYFIHYNDEKRAIPKGDFDTQLLVTKIVGLLHLWGIHTGLGQGAKFERSAIEGPIIGGPFSLINTEGQIVNEHNLLGNWVLLYFGYTSSPDVGPAEVQKMVKSVEILESKQNLRILPLFVTIDPQRDTPAQLRAYLREFNSRIVGLTGPVSAIRQMAQEYRVFFKKVDEEGDDYLVESSHNMYLVNPHMEVVRCFGVEYSAEELTQAILKEMMKTGT